MNGMALTVVIIIAVAIALAGYGATAMLLLWSPAARHLKPGTNRGEWHSQAIMENRTDPQPSANPEDAPAGEQHVAGRVKAPGEYFTSCPVCGQAYDLRELDEVLHHTLGRHDPIPSAG
jgi:hypothetical protein